MALTNSLKEDASGAIFVNNQDGAGTALTSTLNGGTKQSLDVNISNTTAIPVSGTITATNPSVGTTGTTAPTSATEAGGLVSTTGPTVTSGNLSALSLTTASALRVDGSAVTQPVSGTVAVSAITGALPAGANALGSVSVSNFPATQPVSGTVAVTQSTSPWVTSISTALPAGTNSIGSVVVPQLSSATGTITSVALSLSSVSILASNAARKGFILVNDSTLTNAFVAFAATATTSAYTVKIAAGGSYESGTLSYTGAISAISSLASGNMRVTELT